MSGEIAASPKRLAADTVFEGGDVKGIGLVGAVAIAEKHSYQ